MDEPILFESDYGPCDAAVRAVLGRASGLSAFEIIGLAHARDLFVESDTWNAAIDALESLVDRAGRRPYASAAADEAKRMTWLAATVASRLPDLARTHVVSHGPAFSAATGNAANVVAVAALAAVVGDRISPSLSGVLSAPWRGVIEVSPNTPARLS